MATNAIRGSGTTLQFNAALSGAIAGTRTSATIFTRTAGTWTIDELIGLYCKSYVGGAETTYAWTKIIDNDTTTLTVDGTLLAAANNVKTGVVICEIMSLSGTRSRTAIEILTCDSANQAMEVIAGAMNEGEINATLIYDGSDSGVYNTLNTAFQAGTKATAVITYQGCSSRSGTAMITSLGTPAFGSPDDPVTLDLTLRFSGQTTYTDKPA